MLPSMSQTFVRKIPRLPWKYQNDTWWKDDPTFYHGTHMKNIPEISKDGLMAGGGSKGRGVYLALDPFTARGYAAMSGGERNFRKADRPQTVPLTDRVVVVVRIPVGELDRLILSPKDARLNDEAAWEEEGRGDPRYWELAEVVYPDDIPPKFLMGYMLR